MAKYGELWPNMAHFDQERKYGTLWFNPIWTICQLYGLLTETAKDHPKNHLCHIELIRVFALLLLLVSLQNKEDFVPSWPHEVCCPIISYRYIQHGQVITALLQQAVSWVQAYTRTWPWPAACLLCGGSWHRSRSSCWARRWPAGTWSSISPWGRVDTAQPVYAYLPPCPNRVKMAQSLGECSACEAKAARGLSRLPCFLSGGPYHPSHHHPALPCNMEQQRQVLQWGLNKYTPLARAHPQ